MNKLLILVAVLVLGGGVAYFLCRRLVGWLLEALASAAAESERFGVETRTLLVVLLRGLVLLYVVAGWVAFCVAATHRVSMGTAGWRWWLSFLISFVVCELTLARAVRDLGERDAALQVSRGTYDTDKIWMASMVVSFVLSWGTIAGFVVLTIWPQLIPIGYPWVSWTIKYL